MEIQVLLIDDDATSRDALAGYLQDMAEFRVTDHGSGDEALRHLETAWREYTVVFLDLVLGPPVSGEQVLQEIVHRYPRLPVVVFTGRDPTRGIQTLGQGAYAYMRRPLDPMQMISIVQDLAQQRTILSRVARDVKEFLTSDVCVAWRLERRQQRFRVTAWAGDLDEEYAQGTTLDARDDKWLKFFDKGSPVFLRDITDPDVTTRYFHQEAAKKRGWTSLVSIPLVHEERIIGLLDSYTCEPLEFADRSERHRTMRMLRAFAAQAAGAVRFADLSRRTQALQEIDQTLADTMEEDTILRQILYKALELVGASLGWLYTVNASTGNLILKDSLGVPSDLLDAERRLGEGITGSVAKEGVAFNASDVSQVACHKPIPGLEVNSEVAVPLRRGEQTIGVLSAQSRFLNAFTRDDVDLLTSLAAQAAIAIERAKLSRHLQQVGHMALLGEFGGLAKYVVEAVRDLTGADVNLWMMSDKEGEGDKFLRVVTSTGDIRKDFVKNARLSTEPGRSINAQALEEARPIFIDDIFGEHKGVRFFYVEAARQHGWHSFMVVPLFGRDDEPLGTLSLYGKVVGKFGKTEAELVQTFANQAAIAFQQQNRAIALRQLAEVGPSLAESMTDHPRHLLEQVVDFARSLTEADCAVIYPYDPIEGRFLTEEDVVSVGVRNPLSVFVDTPRPNGVAEAIRRVGAIVVHDIETGDVQIGLGAAERDVSNFDVVQTIRSAKFVQQEDIKAFVGISLRAAKKAEGRQSEPEEVGILHVGFRAPHRFGREELQVIRIYAQQAALAIHNASILDESQTRLELLDALHEISLDVLQHLNRAELLEAIIERAANLIAREDRRGVGAAYWQCNHEARKAVVEYSRNSDFRGIEVGFDEGLIGEVMRTGDVQYRNNYPQWNLCESVFAENNLIGHMKNVIALPVKQDDKVMGIIGISDSGNRGPFSRDDVDLLRRFADPASIAIQNARLVEQERISRQQAETLRQVAAAISSNLETEDLAGKILDELAGVVEFRKATIQLIQDDRRTLLAFRGFDTEGIDSWLLRPISQDALVTRIAASKQPLILSDSRQHPDWEIRPCTKDVRSWAGVPLVYGGEMLGLLTLDHNQTGFYSQAQRDSLVAFANHAAIAVKNSRLFEQAQHRIRDLEVMNTVVETISTEFATGLRELLQAIVARIAESLNCTHCTIFLSQEKSDGLLLVPEVSYGPNSELSMSRRFKPGEGLAGWVFEHGQPVMLADAQEDDRFAPARSKGDSPISMLVAPVQVGEEVVGVVCADQDMYGGFDKNDQQLLDALAHHIGIAVERDRLRRAQIDAVRADYVQDVAHQLIGPLSGLRAHADNLLQGRLTVQRGRTVLSALVEQAGHLQRYAENFGYAARTGRSIFDPSEFRPERCGSDHLVQLLISYSKNFQGQAKAKSIRGPRVNEVSFRGFPTLMIDRDLFETLILNLYDNAVKYSYESAPIITAGRVLDAEVEIEVINHGIPIYPEDIPKVFQRYYRTEVAEEHAVLGTGIGLFICRQIAKLHGGTIRALPSKRSIYGNEVRFILALPIAGT